jgi:L-cysteine desulfidase
MITKELSAQYVALLRRELIPALGCTEPIAIAYAAARARRLLGCMPTSMTVHCSGNIIKNVKSVIVPTTNGLRGIDTSAILGALAGDPELGMEVLRNIKPEQVEHVRQLRDTGMCKILPLKSTANLHILLEVSGNGHSALVEIRDAHTNIIREERDGMVVTGMASGCASPTGSEQGYCDLSIENIYWFAKTVNLSEIEPILEKQLDYNMAIAQEGLRGEWGAQVGKTLLASGDSLANRAAAYAAAGSDARMGGCVLPVIINSGSGNQGMTVSLPVIVFAQEKGLSREEILRALALSNLVALFQKSFIGKLSAYCGAVSAACGSAAGIAYLCGDSLEVIEDTVVNTIANVSGMVCDGAKSSCAAKIATAVQAGFLGHEMAIRGHAFRNGEGLVKSDADKTVEVFGRMAREGMRTTDEEILRLMVDA